MQLQKEEQKEILDGLFDKYNRKEFIIDDPISIPHCFNKKEDIEISGFFSAILAWGQRSQIIKSGQALMNYMDHSPYDFVCSASNKELDKLTAFYYRTFKAVDVLFFIRVLRSIYAKGGLEALFTKAYKEGGSVKSGLAVLYEWFLNEQHEPRSIKHIANVDKGSSAKRLNMFLRWMVRTDCRGVDFGLWKDIPPSALFMPLDVHSSRVARELQLLVRRQNDWKAVVELTEQLKSLDNEDPVKYDFALFGFGVNRG